jgi:hypothetical protein
MRSYFRRRLTSNNEVSPMKRISIVALFAVAAAGNAVAIAQTTHRQRQGRDGNARK